MANLKIDFLTHSVYFLLWIRPLVLSLYDNYSQIKMPAASFLALAGTLIHDIVQLEPFEQDGDPNSVGIRWGSWLKSLQLYYDSKGLLIDKKGMTTN